MLVGCFLNNKKKHFFCPNNNWSELCMWWHSWFRHKTFRYFVLTFTDTFWRYLTLLCLSVIMFLTYIWRQNECRNYLEDFDTDKLCHCQDYWIHLFTDSIIMIFGLFCIKRDITLSWWRILKNRIHGIFVMKNVMAFHFSMLDCWIKNGRNCYHKVHPFLSILRKISKYTLYRIFVPHALITSLI
jgi:hypothetical protein